MAKYFIRATIDGNDEYFALDATTEITKSLTGSATSFTTSSGSEQSDNYVNKNNVISFTGVISDIKTRKVEGKFRKSTGDFINKLEKLKDSKAPFTVFINGESNTSTSGFSKLDNCVFESLTIKQDGVNGGKFGGPQSYKISFTAKQIRFVDRAKLTRTRAPVLRDTTAREKPVSPKSEETTKVFYKRKNNLIYTSYNFNGQIITENAYNELVRDIPEAAEEYERVVPDSEVE